jgi:DNA sulfur modification protein DndB
VLALRLRQPGVDPRTELFMFTMTPEQLLKMCVILRRAHGNAAAYQRMVVRKRLPKVADFVRRGGAILPTNIIVHLSEKTTATELKDQNFKDVLDAPVTLSNKKDCNLVVLNIPNEYASLELIDGQHRLYGFVNTDDATRKSFNLVALGIKNLDISKRRDTFVAINDNSRRVDPNLVAFLRYTSDNFACQADSALMAIRVVVDLNKISPFKNAIRLLDVGKQVITLKGFSGYDLKGLLGKNGLLRKYYPNNQPDEYIQVLRIYFSTIQNLFRKEWKDPHTYIVTTNRGISAFLKLLRSILRAERDQLSHAQAFKYLRPLKSGWGSWKIKELKQKYVGSQGWKEFHKEMVQEIRKKFPNFK